MSRFTYTYRRWVLKSNPTVTIRGTKNRCRVWVVNPHTCEISDYMDIEAAKPLAVAHGRRLWYSNGCEVPGIHAPQLQEAQS